MNCQFILNGDGGWFFPREAKKKSEVFSYISLISRDLTNYFPRNFSILNATGEKNGFTQKNSFYVSEIRAM